MWVVLKFGGTSVSSLARWQTIAAVVAARRAEGLRPLVVCSAIAGVSNLLDALLRAAIRGGHARLLGEIEAKHTALGAELGVPVPADLLHELQRISTGVSLTGESSPRLQARVMATGELLLTRMAATFLGAGWYDARALLRSSGADTDFRRYLSATCGHEADPSLAARFTHDVALTQGFIASDAAGDTVLLGRGGSDTSAALFAARLGAARLEIWTDVPGMYTADPRLVPGARMLDRLDYDEAQELASMGAKVLHPRCISPVRAHGIPLWIKSTLDPEAPGTVITRAAHDTPQVKAVSARKGVTLVSMDTLGMWQNVGFLADVFGVFKRHGLSVDLVATSEANVTASLDAAANVLDTAALTGLVRDLAPFCRAKTIGPCAVVSLVGSRIRGALHRLGPALEAFEEQHIYLVSQAASDLNVSFVVDEAQAEGLVRKLHALLFETVDAAPAATHTDTWWRRRRDELLALRTSPLYVYDGPTLREAAARLAGLASVDHAFYAVKANPHPGVLAALDGVGFECVSLAEIEHVRRHRPDAEILFTPNFAPAAEYTAAFEAGAHVTVDNLWALESWPTLFAGREIFLRVDCGHGRGHHRHVRTAGPASKFGIGVVDLERARDACARIGSRVVGLHAHSGSGILETDTWARTAATLAAMLPLFPDAHTLDVGGGLGVGDRPSDAGVDLALLDARLGAFRRSNPGLKIWIEPGRWLVARAGVLLMRVTQLKRKGDRTFVGVDTGMNSMLRPALYGAFHEILNLTRLDEPDAIVADIVGPICESGDVLGAARSLPDTYEADVLLLAHAGAYGHAMASSYNLRAPAGEIVLP